MAAKMVDIEQTPRPGMLTSTKAQRTMPRSTSARERRQSGFDRGVSPNLSRLETEAIGSGHRSSANAVSAKTSDGNVLTVRSGIQLIKSPVLIGVLIGSGHLATVVRETGIQAFEYDLTVQGGRNNLLHANVFRELREMIAHLQCIGVWFGYPCGTSSLARRHDGGPPPLR